MSDYSLKSLMKQYGLFYLTALIVLMGLKLFYRGAGCEELKWILSPTARWVSALSGISFEYVPRTGYVSHDMRFIIARSCSGFQFMIITAAALIFSFFHRAMSAGKEFHSAPRRLLCGFGWILAGFAVSFVLTILVNGMRILLSIYLPLFLGQMPLSERLDAPGGWLTQDRLHTLIGTAVYFTSLLVICRLMDSLTLRLFGGLQKSLPGALRSFLQPVFWYFFFVLGIPVLNRAWKKGPRAFADYAALVLFVCAVPLILFSFADAVKRRARRRRTRQLSSPDHS